ncbi:MAG TPA: hypothetical protein VFB38_03545 [Chthonomonadaceae bacterium]|nr:hypothetical protein [Chthonomonadaceae bacterium]
MTVTIQEAQRNLSELLARIASGGKEIIMAEDGTPVARQVPIIEKAARRVPGSAAGKLVIPPEFYEPLPEKILESFVRGYADCPR